MIYCVWYPSGGFGHFINAVLTIHGDNFVRPSNSLEFSKTGDSHSLQLVVPKYARNCWPGNIEFLADKNYCVLIDNGITDESETFRSTFPDATVVKLCYSDRTWPVVARTMIEKAMSSSLQQQLPITEWELEAPWAHREKYFLFLRDHEFRHSWKHTIDQSLYIDDTMTYKYLYNSLNNFVKVEPFEPLWIRWRAANARYLDPVELAQKIMSLVKHKKSLDLTHVTDIWTQAVIYYYIWITYKIEVPHNDFSEFFSNTDQIVGLVS